MIFDDDFYAQILQKKYEIERMEPENLIEHTRYDKSALEGDFTFIEVINVINDSKLKKAYLDIPNEAAKNPNAQLLLFNLFNLCFRSGLAPTDWMLSDIKPIPKKDKDSRDPLNNRCITIMCCIAKMFSKLLNKRLQSYLESNHILANEQNGFRANRSCMDHIFALCTILRNRKIMGQDTFIAFIDLY